MNQLLDSLTYEADRGRLSLHSARYVMVQPGLLVDLQKQLETHLPYDAAGILCDAARGEGGILATRLKNVFEYSADQILGSMGFMLVESGWGVFTIEMLDLERLETVIKIVDSPFAEIYGPSVNAVCHYLLGLFEGASAVVFDREVVGQEVQCAARGDGACRLAISVKPA